MPDSPSHPRSADNSVELTEQTGSNGDLAHRELTRLNAELDSARTTIHDPESQLEIATTFSSDSTLCDSGSRCQFYSGDTLVDSEDVYDSEGEREESARRAQDDLLIRRFINREATITLSSLMDSLSITCPSSPTGTEPSSDDISDSGNGIHRGDTIILDGSEDHVDEYYLTSLDISSLPTFRSGPKNTTPSISEPSKRPVPSSRYPRTL